MWLTEFDSLMTLSLPDFRENSLASKVLELALDEYPDLDTGLYAAILQRYINEVRACLDVRSSTIQVIKAINYYLFYEQGYAASEDNYYDPRNSFMNEVIDRKTGVPLLIGVLYMELGRGLGLNMEGINFPGQFLVRVCEGGCELIINPYEGGVLLNHDDLNEQLRDMYGDNAPSVESSPQLVEASTDKDVMIKILTNLKNIYSSNGNIYKLLMVMDRIISIDPDSPHELLDRAMIYEELDYARQAVQDYQRYLELSPDSEDVEEVQSVIRDLETKVGYLH